jgi:hypothetical protein
MKRKIANFSLVLVSLACGLFVMEAGFSILDLGGLYKSGVSRISDPHLRYRLPPNLFAEIDSRGFRNKTEKGPFNIVVLGDSHAYGYGVRAENSFPANLSRLTGKSVYNFGMGGYGPAQYAYLVDQAVALQPKTLVVSLFMGNDPINACEIANILEYWRGYFENHGLITQHCGSSPLPEQKIQKSRLSRIKAWLKNTRTGSLLNQHVWLPIRNRISLQLHSGQYTDRVVVNDKLVKSIFPVWPNYTPAAADGIGITKHFLSVIRSKTEQAGINLVLAILPSKQNIYLDFLTQLQRDLPEEFVGSVVAERAYIKELTGYGLQSGFKVADATSLLAKAASDNTVLYPADDDSHPTSAGYLIYAKSIADKLP